MSQRSYFLDDEIAHHQKAYAQALARFHEVVILNADHEEAWLFAHIALCLRDHVTLVTEGEIADPPRGAQLLKDCREYQPTPGKRTLFLLFKNRRSDIPRVAAQLHYISQFVSGTENRLFFLSESYINDFTWGHYYELAEEEYGHLMEAQPEDSEARLDYQLDRYCAQLFQQGAGVTVLRYSNLYGASITQAPNEITDICRRAAQTGEIAFAPDDKVHTKSYTFLCDLISAVSRLLNRRSHIKRSFHSYHIHSCIVNPYQIKMALSSVAEEAKLIFPGEIAAGEARFSVLQRLKIAQFFPEPKRLFSKTLEQCYYSFLPNEAFDQAFAAQYHRRTGGKIESIRQLEMDILQDVDRICKRHDIQYFVVGGSLLGAVRHGGFIPWDDDLDIVMLREDYERFRRVAPGELSDSFYYQSYRNGDGSHYLFDKIRVKDTLFSTNWSALFNIEDGIFLDVLVYDKTSNIRLLQKLHVLLLMILRRMINIKWLGRPNRKIHYYLSILAFPFIRLLPFGFFHSLFEACAKLFRRSRRADYLIDTVGLNIKRVGAFPRAWYEQYTLAEFEGQAVPITAAYDACLQRWYGGRYMELLPPSKRLGHKVKERSLGPYTLPPEEKSP